MQLIKRDQLFERKVVLLHNEWNLQKGRMLFSTRIDTQRFIRWASTPPSMHEVQPVYHENLKANSWPHEETSVTVDAGYCSYLIFFRSDGTVESRAFA